MISEQLVVAAVQLSSTADIQHNLVLAGELIDQAVKGGAQLVLLPENFAHMPNTESERQQASEVIGTGPIQEFLSRRSEQHAIYLIAGSVPIVSTHPGKVFAASICFDPSGSLLARYDKIHLFDVQLPNGKRYAESDGFEYGALSENDGLFETPWGTFCMTICYDLRFPELFRKASAQNVVGFLVPAAFTYETGKAHWEILLRARAIENMAYVIASAQHGTHSNGRQTWGYSMVLDPWGKLLACQASGDGVVLATLDLARQEALRRDFPCLEHRRLD